MKPIKQKSSYKVVPVLVTGSIVLAYGCASPPPKVAPPKPIRSAPIPPPGARADFQPPPSDGLGGFQTPNSGLSDIEAVWHVRSALNVAALACDDPSLIANYNALLKRQKAGLAGAYDAEARAFQANAGAGWRAAMDSHMTRLYNFFAQPFVQRTFCVAAARVATEANVMPSVEFQRSALTAIQRLDAPFQDFYRAYDRYRRDLAQWQADGGQGAVAAARVDVATTSTAPWRIQLGAFSGQEAAEAAWVTVRTRAPGLGEFKPHYEAASLKGLVRLQIGPVSDRQQALRLCAAAAVAALDCLPVVPSP